MRSRATSKEAFAAVWARKSGVKTGTVRPRKDLTDRRGINKRGQKTSKRKTLEREHFNSDQVNTGQQ